MMRTDFLHAAARSAAVLLFPAAMLGGCSREAAPYAEHAANVVAEDTSGVPHARPVFTRPFAAPVTIHRYFCVIDSLVLAYDSLTPYRLTEHLLVHANPRLIDTLAATDYYEMMARDSFVADQRQLYAIRRGDSLLIPDSLSAAAIQGRLDSLLIDVNVPEYRLRILLGTDTLYSFPVRVGQDRKRYLQLAGREMSLRTDLGAGRIVRVERDPYFLNPVDGKHFTRTRRDDGKVTEMPLIPWIEPELNGLRHGDLIHPTTNPATLRRASSNGCIGTREGDAWRIYYHAPVGTRIVVRYDLEQVTAKGDTLRFPDIYGTKRREVRRPAPAPAVPDTLEIPVRHLPVPATDTLAAAVE